MQKTLGGNRLGSGNKMKVNLHHYNRSTHDLGHVWRSTMSAGTLVPCLKQLALPGDTWDIKIGADVKTHPTVGPLFGSYKVEIHTFLCPIRLYHGQLHNNKLGIGLKMQEVKLPLLTLKAAIINDDPLPLDIDNAQINPSSILSYLGIRGVGLNLTAPSEAAFRDFNGVPLLAYWDIYKNYYANKQEDNGVVIHTVTPVIAEDVTSFNIIIAPPDPTFEAVPLTGGTDANIQTTSRSKADIDSAPAAAVLPEALIVILDGGERVPFTRAFRNFTNPTPETLQANWNWPVMGQRTIIAYDFLTPSDIPFIEPQLTPFPLENIDQMRQNILEHVSNPAPFSIKDQALPPYSYIMDQSASGFQYMMNNQEGLGIKTYMSDLFNNWLNTEFIDGVGGINEITSIDTSGGSFEINELIIQRKIYDMLNRINVSGGTYNDWINAAYDTEGLNQFETPMYMGGLIKELVFQEVVSNSEATSEDGSQPLGTLAGKGIMANKHKGGNLTIRVEEPAYIIAIASITPRIDYSQGNDWDINLKTMDDFHKPGLDEIGFEEVITEQMHWADTSADTVVGGIANWTQKSAGKRPAWMNYMTETNKVKGNFAIPAGMGTGGEMFMTLNRQYEIDPTTLSIKDLTTYIDPIKYNQIFAQSSLDAQNFWVQIGFDITARRKMSGRLMPNL